MGKNKKGSAAKARAEIERLQACRRKDLIKILAALALMMLIILGKTTLEYNGTIEMGNMVLNGAMWLTAFVLAIFAGSAGVDMAKCGRGIEEARKRASLDKNGR